MKTPDGVILFLTVEETREPASRLLDHELAEALEIIDMILACEPDGEDLAWALEERVVLLAEIDERASVPHL